MMRPKTCIRLLLLAHLTLGSATAIYGSAAYGGRIPLWPPHTVLKGILIGIFLGQAVSVGLWTGLSSGATRRRIGGGLLAATLIWAAAVTSTHSWKNGGAWIVFLLWFVVPWAAVASAASVLQRYGIRCVATEGRSRETRPEGIQFSLRQLAFIIATCAILLGMVRCFKSAGPALTFLSFLSLLGAFAIIFTVQALVCLWAALGAGTWPRRIGLPWLRALGWAPLMAQAFGGHPVHFMQFGVIAFVCISLVIESLLAVRFAGYRIVRAAIADPDALHRFESERAWDGSHIP